jgi:diguanylate cyclase (GGDEF)-like protein
MYDLHTPAALKELLQLLEGNPEEVLVQQSIHIDALRRLVDELAVAKRRISQLERERDEDPLVPVLNRRAFTRDLRRAIAGARRYGRPGALLFFDLNGLKLINDRYGHGVGDLAITRIAKTLILACRETDSIGRLGGDEFAVLMPESNLENAEKRGCHIAALLRQIPLMAGEEALTLSAAFGSASFTGRETVGEVLSVADAAMYAKKPLRQ